MAFAMGASLGCGAPSVMMDGATGDEDEGTTAWTAGWDSLPGAECETDKDCAEEFVCDPWTGTCQEEANALCGEQTPIVRKGKFSGFNQCEDGTIRRAEEVDCGPPPTGSLPTCTGDEAVVVCESDADCDQFPGQQGHCIRKEYIAGYPYEIETSCGCVYTCQTSADCGGRFCHCPFSQSGVSSSEAFPTCESASCDTDADCEYGECGFFSKTDPYSTSVGLACRTPDDACRYDSDCHEPYLNTCISWGSSWSCEWGGY